MYTGLREYEFFCLSLQAISNILCPATGPNLTDIMPIKTIAIVLFSVLFLSAPQARGQSESLDELSQCSWDSLMEEGRDFFQKREASKALSRFLVVGEGRAEASDRHKQELAVRALNNAGCVFKFFYYDYPRAYEYFNRAYELCKKIDYVSFLPVILVNMGDLLSDYGLTHYSPAILDEARNLFNDCFEKSIKDKNWELLTTSFFNLSGLDYNIDLSKYKAIFSSEIPDDTPDIEFVRLQYMGIKNLQERRFKEARDCFSLQLGVINTRWEPRRDSICAYINIAETYKDEKDYDSEARCLLQALDLADSSQIVDLGADIANKLAECYKNLGDDNQFLKFHTLFLEKREFMHNARLSNIGELKYLSDLREEEVRAQKSAIKNKYLRFIAFILGLVLLVIIFFTAVILRKNKALKGRNMRLFEQYQLLLAADSAPKGEKYGRSNLDDSKKEELISRINEVMNDPDQICREDFSSKELAQLVASNTSYVSQVINEKYGVSFSTLLGNSRIKIVCHRISDDPQYQKLTIEGIANSVGFKSRTAFINAFKREVGLTPSQYIKMAAEKKD